jgi:DNA gyrase subunit B
MYEGQTKNKFANQEVRKIVNKVFSQAFEKYMGENPSQAGQIINKIKLAAKSRIAAQKAKEMTRKKDPNDFTALAGKLARCSSKNPEETELFIVEGDSAGGSAKSGRDSKFQAILPLRGKVINAERARIDKLFNNNEITSMITAFGTNIGEEFDIGKLRYHKIIIMTDADVDGSHIRTLLLTFLYRYFKPLIEEGYVYIAVPPLYKIGKGSKAKYVYTENEKTEHMKTLSENAKPNIQRYKGLGEMSDVQLWETTMDPEKRMMLRVTIDDALEADEVFTDLMGDLVEPRRKFIENNAQYAEIDV